MIQQIYPSTPHPYRYELNKDMHFAAAPYVPSEQAGQCAELHGHTYFANITIAGNELDDSGFLVNFSQIKKLVHDRYDHSLLNGHLEFADETKPDSYPTTENVARTICELIQEHLNAMPNKPTCVQVFLRETPTSYVVFRPGAGGAIANVR
jgi:6-pyruvoyltetrahydropterin/6-carboxytetrahydropterin synthase